MGVTIAKKNTISYFICMLILPVLIMLLTIGCSPVGNYTPDPLMAKGLAKNINITKPVKISNNQPYDQKDLLAFRGISVNYNTFTQSLVDALNMELNKNKLIENDSANKHLQVAVTNVEMAFGSGAANFRATIDAEVKMGNGQIKQYHSSRASYASGFNIGTAPTKPLNAAFYDLVKYIVEDPVIQEYINN